jgi:hypothetical protein
MYIVVANIVGAIVIALIIIILSNKLIQQKALNKYIIPELTKYGFKLAKIKPLMFLKKGQFKTEKIHLRPFTLGYPIYYSYYDITYVTLKDENVKFHVTARVSVFLLVVYKIEFSHSL